MDCVDGWFMCPSANFFLTRAWALRCCQLVSGAPPLIDVFMEPGPPLSRSGYIVILMSHWRGNVRGKKLCGHGSKELSGVPVS